MKLFTLLHLVAVSSAFVIVDERVLSQVAIQTFSNSEPVRSKISSKDELVSQAEDTIRDIVGFSKNAFDNAVDAVSDVAETAKSSFQCHSSMTAFDAKSWLESTISPIDGTDLDEDQESRPHRPPHHRKPHHGRRGKPNQTIYELISTSKYTTKLAKLINEFDDLVEILNGTSSNITLFAPTDKAFEKIPDHHKKPSKELIRNILAYHVSPGFYPAGRVLVSHTIPSAYSEERLGGEAQRLRVGLGLFKGLNINFYSKIIAANIFATNGVIHGVDSLILPPPPALKIIELLPGEFSTLQLGLTKTGLSDLIKDSPHSGGTLFAPSNGAFKKLGPKINAFLFSKYGEKYLKALLKYHVVANQTLYSDAFYKGKDADDSETVSIPKGRFHIDLPTLLEGKSLSIDVARWGGFITIKINGFNGVTVQDGLASDGVIHVVSNVLIPPKTPGVLSEDDDLTVEDLRERLDAYVEPTAWWEL